MTTLSTLEVRAIAGEVVQAYDIDKGEPRHIENLKNFQTIFVWMGKINVGIRIGIGIAVFFVGLPAMAASIITIVRFVKELH